MEEGSSDANSLCCVKGLAEESCVSSDTTLQMQCMLNKSLRTVVLAVAMYIQRARRKTGDVPKPNNQDISKKSKTTQSAIKFL